MPAPDHPVELTPPDISAYKAGNTGVDYVTTMDSGKPGPHVMINAVTHGNEICGAIALDRLFRSGIEPTQGRLTLAFVNHMAYSRFDPKLPRYSRLVDEDINRVWVEERLDGDEDNNELRLWRTGQLPPRHHRVQLEHDPTGGDAPARQDDIFA